jgi:hypothetical protein
MLDQLRRFDWGWVGHPFDNIRYHEEPLKSTRRIKEKKDGELSTYFSDLARENGYFIRQVNGNDYVCVDLCGFSKNEVNVSFENLENGSVAINVVAKREKNTSDINAILGEKNVNLNIVLPNVESVECVYFENGQLVLLLHKRKELNKKVEVTLK